MATKRLKCYNVAQRGAKSCQAIAEAEEAATAEVEGKLQFVTERRHSNQESTAHNEDLDSKEPNVKVLLQGPEACHDLDEARLHEQPKRNICQPKHLKTLSESVRFGQGRLFECPIAWALCFAVTKCAAVDRVPVGISGTRSRAKNYKVLRGPSYRRGRDGQTASDSL